MVQMRFSSCPCLLCSARVMDEDVCECPIINSLKIAFQVTEMCLNPVLCPECLAAAALSSVFPFQEMFPDVFPNILWHSWSDYLLERNQFHIGPVGRQNLFSSSKEFASHILSQNTILLVIHLALFSQSLGEGKRNKGYVPRWWR